MLGARPLPWSVWLLTLDGEGILGLSSSGFLQQQSEGARRASSIQKASSESLGLGGPSWHLQRLLTAGQTTQLLSSCRKGYAGFSRNNCLRTPCVFLLFFLFHSLDFH